MKAKIKAEINSGSCPVWLSPKIGETSLKILQNFSVSLERIAAFNEQTAEPNGPGDVPCVILRGFSRVASKNDFESAELTYSGDGGWSFGWLNEDDFGFFYSEEAPFEKSGDKCVFAWRNFFTDACHEKKEVSLSVEAYSIPGCGDGEQGVLSAMLAYPAYIISFQPDEEKSDGIVQNDTAKRSCIVSRYGNVELCWNGAADFTDVTELKKNGVSVSESFMINDSYAVKNITESSCYELSVTNSYRFPHRLTYEICKTDWQKKTEEKGIFQNDIYGDANLNPRIFSYQGSLYAYFHPVLYKRDDKGEWKSLTENKLYKDGFSCHSSCLHDGTFYAALSSEGSKNFSMCRCDMEHCGLEWQEDEGTVQLPYRAQGAPICCGYAVSEREEYFYCVEGNDVAFCEYEENSGWNNRAYYVAAPESTSLLCGDMIFRGERLYLAMLCAEDGDAKKKAVYLYDSTDDHYVYCLMKRRASESAGSIALLETANNLWIATDREIINCDGKTRDGLFYPPRADDKRAWFGSDENNVFGIFPDKNLWVYNTFDDSSANKNHKPAEKEKEHDGNAD